MSNFSNLSGCELVTLANLIAVSISKNIPSDEIEILATLFTAIGDNLAIIALNK